MSVRPKRVKGGGMNHRYTSDIGDPTAPIWKEQNDTMTSQESLDHLLSVSIRSKDTCLKIVLRYLPCSSAPAQLKLLAFVPIKYAKTL